MSKVLTTSETLQQRNGFQSLEKEDSEWMQDEDQDKKDSTTKKQQPPEEQPITGQTSAGYACPDLANWMPLRGDFETEHENDAEIMLMDLAFNDDDSQADIEVKLRLIENYNRKLDDRIKRKKFIVDYGLLDYKRIKRKLKKKKKYMIDCDPFSE